jgi:hypothetical protein
MLGAMEPDADYPTSYGPFLRLLDSSDELEMLAARPGYSKDIGRNYLAGNCDSQLMLNRQRIVTFRRKIASSDFAG